MENYLAFARWRERHETAESRKYRRLSWFAVPVMLHAYEYAVLVSGEDGPACFGAYVGLLQVAVSAYPPERRGILVRDDGRPHTAETLAFVLRMPQPIISETIRRLIDVGLLQSLANLPGDSPGNATAPGYVRDGTDGRTEQYPTGQHATAASSVVGDGAMRDAVALARNHGIQSKSEAKLLELGRLVEAYGRPRVDEAVREALKNGCRPLLAPTVSYIKRSLGDCLTLRQIDAMKT